MRLGAVLVAVVALACAARTARATPLCPQSLALEELVAFGSEGCAVSAPGTRIASVRYAPAGDANEPVLPASAITVRFSGGHPDVRYWLGIILDWEPLPEAYSPGALGQLSYELHSPPALPFITGYSEFGLHAVACFGAKMPACPEERSVHLGRIESDSPVLYPSSFVDVLAGLGRPEMFPGDDTSDAAMWLLSVPEPAMTVLCGLALATLFMHRRARAGAASSSGTIGSGWRGR